jgi:NADH-quinone oxidoreductase subunit A
MDAGAFLPIAILFVFALVVCGAIFGITNILGPKILAKDKLTTYECGVKPEGSARTPFRLQFYLIAVMFLLFDVEAAFFLPWALVYRESLATGGALLLAMSVYLGLVVVGLLYIYKKDCLKLT